MALFEPSGAPYRKFHFAPSPDYASKNESRQWMPFDKFDFPQDLKCNMEQIGRLEGLEQNNNKSSTDRAVVCDDEDDNYDASETPGQSKGQSPEDVKEEEAEPSHHARRPMNAFLIFCKRHRTVVRERYPQLENRAITKILGEWWAALNDEEKSSYVDLAKQYKDAFLSANPDFKWYKLPAPPLRTLSTRPSNSASKITETKVEQNAAVFTPGKLADESQLGNITSLMKENFGCCSRDSSDNTETEHRHGKYWENNNEKEEEDASSLQYACKEEACSGGLENMTQQEIIDKVVVDCICEGKQPKNNNNNNNNNNSSRSCKGKRYAEFMVNGKLLNNKKDRKRLLQDPKRTPLELDETIKKLAERTTSNRDNNGAELDLEQPQDDRRRMFQAADFDLDAKIEALPSLSIDLFQERKKEGKKRKLTKSSKCVESTEARSETGNSSLTGSQKRKARKQQIKKRVCEKSDETVDLFGLATLADIAAKKPKINQ